MANTLTAYTPEMWSKTSLSLLREKIVMPPLVRIDFSTDLAQAGDTVNTRKPATLTANTVNTITGVTVQDVSATNVPVTLNSHKESTFKISDREATRSLKNLTNEYLDPAMLAIANAVDSSLLGLYTDITTVITVASGGSWATMLGAVRTRMNKNKVQEQDRRLVLSNDDEGNIGNLPNLQQFQQSGDNNALRTGGIGRLKNFDTYRADNVVSLGSPAVRKNIAFHKDCFALVVRQLANAAGITPGAVQTTSVDPDAGLSLRITISYNATLLSTQVTCDILYGVKTLDEKRGVLINGSGASS